MFFIKNIVSFVVTVILVMQIAYSMDALELENSTRVMNSESVAKFVILGTEQSQQPLYRDNVNAPFFFKLIDEEGKKSHILFTEHATPMETLHSEIIKIFEENTSKLVSEQKKVAPESTWRELNAFADSETVPLPDYFYELEWIDTRELRALKPWAVFAVHATKRLTQVHSDGMDRQLRKVAEKKGYSMEGLETDADVARAVKLPELSTDQVLDLFNKSKTRITRTSYTDEGEAEYTQLLVKSIKEGDILGMERATLGLEKYAFLYNSINTGVRNETMLPNILNQHNDNKGNVFFTVGGAHAVGPKGLLWLLKDHFRIERLTNEGIFLPFEYIPAATEPMSAKE